MPLFMVHGIDSVEGARKRAGVRPAHIEHIRGLVAAGRVTWAGPFLDPVDGHPLGSFLILEAEDRAALDAMMAADPYVAQGVFGTVHVYPVRQVVPGEVG